MMDSIILVVCSVLILFSIFYPQTASNWSVWILLASVVLIGIPHGAIDHIMAGKVYGMDSSWRGQLRFYTMYLGLMIIVAGLWLIQPILGLLFFFAISIYHFGQSDMEDFITTQSRKYIWYTIRGAFIVGLILLADTSVSYSILAQAIYASEASIINTLPEDRLMLYLLLALYSLFFLYAWATSILKNGLRFLVDSLLLLALFLITGPLIGFAVYFALWHSFGHVFEMQRYLRKKNESMSMLQFYKYATPFTLVSLVGLAFLAGINHAMGFEEQFIALMFILISVLTLPHMVIVDKMYGEVGS